MLIIRLIGFIVYLIGALIAAPFIAWLMVLGTLGEAWKRIMTQERGTKGAKGASEHSDANADHKVSGNSGQVSDADVRPNSTQEPGVQGKGVWYPYGGGKRWN